jgi:hypothetical protein
MNKLSFKRCRHSQKSQPLQHNHWELQTYTDLKEELARIWLLKAVYIVLLVTTRMGIIHTRRQFICKLTLKYSWIIIVDVERTIIITHFKCASSLVIQDAMGMRRILLSPVVCLGVPHLSTSPHKRHDFRGGEK